MRVETVVERQNQILGASVNITGTPFSLHYRSDRVPGRRAAYTLNIPLSGKHIQKNLKEIELELTVAGRRFSESFPPTPKQRHSFTWDGQDAEGRPVYGKQPAQIRIGYVYPAFYPRPALTRWQEQTVAIGAWDARTQGLGGWSLNVHHVYDPVGWVLYLGDGRRRSKLDIDQAGIPRNGGSVGEFVIPARDGSQLYIFDSTGRHLSTLEAPTGALLYRFEYDAAGRLMMVEDGDGNSTTIERDATGNPQAIVGPYGQRTSMTLDASGYSTTITNPADETAKFHYANDGLLVGLADPNGNVYRFTYDETGRLTKYEDPAGGGYDLARTNTEHGFQVAMITALGREYSYLVERLPTGEEQRVTKCCGSAPIVMRTDQHGKRKVTYPDETTVIFTEQPDAHWGTPLPRLKNYALKTAGGLLITYAVDHKVIQAENKRTPQTITSTFTVNDQVYGRTFDTSTRQLVFASPSGRKTVAQVNDRGRISEVMAPGLPPMTLHYNERGRLWKTHQGSDDEARVFSFDYDHAGRIASVTNPLDQTVRWEYDLAGRTTKQILPDGHEIQYLYDSCGNLRSLTPPGRPAHSFEYTRLNFQGGYLPPDTGLDGKDTRYSYNADGQLTTITRPDDSTINYTYDEAGDLTMLSFPGGQISYAFDPETRKLVRITAADGGTLAYAYDGPLLTSTTWKGTITGSMHRTYDNYLRITSISVNDGGGVDYRYDADGFLIQAGELIINRDAENGSIIGTTLGGLQDQHNHNPHGELISYRVTFDDRSLYEVQYGRDKLGRITQKVETVEGETNTFAYRYDPIGQLVEVNQNGRTVASYSYDANGNRLSATEAVGSFSGIYDDQDRLLEYGDTTYTYTANGELLSKTTGAQTTSYDYDVLGNLMGVTLPNGTWIEYLVDGHNRRIGKKVNGTLVQGFLYKDLLNPIAKLDGDGNIMARFVYGSRSNVPDYMVKDGRAYRFVADHLGSVRLVVDSETRAIVQRLDYDAYGRVLQDTNLGFQPFGFAGGLYDPDTRLTRFGARDYDATMGRWTAKDPIFFAGGDTNLYRYAIGDPINVSDPTGQETTNIGVIFRILIILYLKITGKKVDLNKKDTEQPAGIEYVEEDDPRVRTGEEGQVDISDIVDILTGATIMYGQSGLVCPLPLIMPDPCTQGPPFNSLCPPDYNQTF